MMDLKPCPFCGGEVHMLHNLDLVPAGIHCIQCRMKVDYYRIKPPAPHEPFERVLSEYAEAWNRRARE